MSPKKSSLKTIYLVRVSMSSGNKISEREDEGDRKEIITFEYPREMRTTIDRLRAKFRHRVTKPCVSFHGLQIAKEDALDDIRRNVEEADAAFKEVDENLGAKVLFIPLSIDAKARGEVYEAVMNSIRGTVLKTLLDRLRDLAKVDKVPSRSRVALLRLCDQMKAWNVLEDPDLDATIEDYKLQFENDVIAPVLSEIEREFKALDSEGAFVEM